MNPNDCTKYPRSPHLPWSEGGTSDDAYLFDTDHFAGKEVVITEKMDGENTSMYRDGIHARSIDGRHHPSRDWVKALHGTICLEILRETERQANLHKKGDIVISAMPQVVAMLTDQERLHIEALEQSTGRNIVNEARAALHQEIYQVTVRASAEGAVH